MIGWSLQFTKNKKDDTHDWKLEAMESNKQMDKHQERFLHEIMTRKEVGEVNVSQPI